MQLIEAGNGGSDLQYTDGASAPTTVPPPAPVLLTDNTLIQGQTQSQAAAPVAAQTDPEPPAPNFCFYCNTISSLKLALQSASILFICASAYYSMVLTDWGTVRSSSGLSSAKEGVAAMWFQATAQWITLLMYIWSLVAPLVCPGRDFN
jgi:Serine incorporator (Serinc)